MDGAVWMLDKIIKEIGKYKDTISLLIIEFNKDLERVITDETIDE
jgi:hypothetical protein